MTQKRTGKHQEYSRQNRKRKDKKINRPKGIPLNKGAKLKRILEEEVVYRRRNRFLDECKKYEKKVAL